MKTIKAFKVFLFCSLSLLLISSCSSTKMALTATEIQSIKNLKPDQNMGLVYFVRPSNFGSKVKLGTTCDSISLGGVFSKRFIYAFIEPGMHKFVSKAENSSEIYLKIEGNKTYFFNQKAKMGTWYAKTELELVDEKTGREMLSNCQLSKDCVAYKKK